MRHDGLASPQDRSLGGQPTTLGDIFGQIRLTTAIAVVGLVGVIVGSLGPWITTVLGSLPGYRGDGRISLGCAIVAILLLIVPVRQQAKLPATVLAFLFTIGAVATAGYDAIHISWATTKVTLFGHQLATTGWGVLAAAAWGGIALAAIAWSFRSWVRWPLVILAIIAAIGLPTASGWVGYVKPAHAKEAASQRPTIPTTPNTTGASATTTAAAQTTTSKTSQSGQPSGTTPCGTTAWVNSVTSCGFAEKVYSTYKQSQPNESLPSQVVALSPATGKTYTMNCGALTDTWVTCRGGNNALVAFQPNVTVQQTSGSWMDAYTASNPYCEDGYCAYALQSGQSCLPGWHYAGQGDGYPPTCGKQENTTVPSG
jgi:hypothetical protein